MPVRGAGNLLDVAQVLQGIRQMEKVTQTTAATAEETSAASDQLNAQAGMTMRLVERLESMVGHDEAGGTPAAEPVVPERRSPLAHRSRGEGGRITMLPRAPRRSLSTDDASVFPADGTYGQF